MTRKRELLREFIKRADTLIAEATNVDVTDVSHNRRMMYLNNYIVDTPEEYAYLRRHTYESITLMICASAIEVE